MRAHSHDVGATTLCIAPPSLCLSAALTRQTLLSSVTMHVFTETDMTAGIPSWNAMHENRNLAIIARHEHTVFCFAFNKSEATCASDDPYSKLRINEKQNRGEIYHCYIVLLSCSDLGLMHLQFLMTAIRTDLVIYNFWLSAYHDCHFFLIF